MTGPAKLITSSWLRLFTMLGLPERVGLMAGAAVGLSVAYLLYASLVTPVVKRDQIQNLGTGVVAIQPPPAQLVNMATRYLPHQPWAADAKYQFRTEDAFVYCGEWKPTDDEMAIRFAPFAMILIPKGAAPDEEPLTISSRSALIRFESPFKFPSKPGRIIGGTLQGETRVTGQDELNLTGRNFEFSEPAMRIWSDHPVRFTYDGHRGSANGVQLDLIPDPEPSGSESVAVLGVRKVILRQNISMDFHVVDDDPGDDGQVDDPIDVSIRCSDSFEFLVEEHLATYSGNVHLRRPTGEGLADTLRCDQLIVQFRPGPEPGTAPPGPLPVHTGPHPPDLDQLASLPSAADQQVQADTDSGNLEFDRLRAVGGQVILTSEENQLTAVMSELIYDGPRRVASLKDPDVVRIQHRSTQMQCPEVTLVHAEGGEIESAWCRGKGWLKYLDPITRQVEFAAQWARQLRKYREVETSLEVIELESEAVVRRPSEHYGLGAELIKLWIRDVELDSEEVAPVTGTAATRTAAKAAASTESEGALSDGRYRPVRMLALNNVALASPDAQGETSRLEVWFVESPQPVIAAAGDTGQPAVQDAVIPASGTADPAAAPPMAAAPATAQAPVRSDAGPRQPAQFPLEIISDLIQVRVALGDGDEELQVTDVWTEGRVQIRQEAEAGKKPLQVTGNRLRLQNQGELQEVLHIHGEPAHVRNSGMHIEGREIHLDRDRNLAWVQGAGLLQLPVEKDLEGNPLAEAGHLDIWWTDQMTFDGQTARFFGNVRTVLNDNRMRCQEMHVLLTRKLSFTEDNSRNEAEDQPTVDVYSILCSDGVDFRGYEYEERRLVSIRHARCAHLALNQQTGNTEASGPGWITTWSRGQGSRAALGPGAEVTANQPLETREDQWEFSKVEFVGKAHGNLKQQSTRFDDEVRIIYGPVDRPLAVIDPESVSYDGLPEEAGIMRCSSLQVIMHERPGRKDGTVELLASGNAFLEGRNFHAQADTISYDESKELYILRSIEPRKATIWRQETLGGKFSSLEAQRMEFSPKRNKLKLDRTTELQVLQ